MVWNENMLRPVRERQASLVLTCAKVKFVEWYWSFPLISAEGSIGLCCVLLGCLLLTLDAVLN